jgi:hypothetical protein
MGATARLPSGCRDAARREATFPAPRPRRPARTRAVQQQLVSMTLDVASELVHYVPQKEFFSSLLEPTLSAASYPPLHKTQGWRTHYIGDIGAIKSPGHPPN